MEDRWHAVNMQDMKGTPWEPIPGHPDREMKSRVYIREEPILPPPVAEENEETIRRLYIRKRDVQKYGFTPGCEGCTAVSRGGVSRNHTEECRNRIEKAMKEEGDGNRAQQAEDRANRKLWKEMERLQREQEKEAKKAKTNEEQDGQNDEE